MLKKKTVLILGASLEQKEIYKLAKLKKFKIIAVDINKLAPCFSFADYKIFESIYSPKKIINKLKKLKLKTNGVTTLGADVPFQIYKIANHFNLPSISFKAGKFASSKDLMKKNFIIKKIATPQFIIGKNFIDIKKNILNKKIKFPLVMKPVDSRGSRGVFFIENNIDIKKYISTSLKFSKKKKIILEKYLPGKQISTEGIFQNGNYIPIGYALRDYKNLKKTLPNFVEDGGTTPAILSLKLKNEIDILISKASESINLNFGTVKGDVVIYKNKPFIIEIAARLSGGYFASDIIPKVYNFNIVNFALNESMHIKNKKIKQVKPKNIVVTQKYIFPKEGYITKVISPKINKINNKIMLFKKTPFLQQKITNHTGRLGTVLSFGQTENKSAREARKIVKNIRIISK